MYFFYICPGWEGSANDARVLVNTELTRFPRAENTIYLVDAGNELCEGYLIPYHMVPYHFREQSSAHLKSNTKEKLFIVRHAQLRNVIDRAFVVLG